MSHIIVNQNDILETFSTRYKRTARDYFKFLKAKDKMSLIEISRKLKRPYRTVQSWKYGAKPPPIKFMESLQRKKLLPFIMNEDNAKFILLVKCLAFVFGDGHIKKNGKEATFAGQKKDLIVLQKEIQKEFNVHCRLDPVGSAYHLSIPAIVTRIITAMGAPKGDKVIQNFKLPKWIFEASKKTKKEFLGTLFGNEGNAIVRDYHTKNAFYPPHFPMSKALKYEKSHMLFLHEIKKMLSEFNIETSAVIKYGFYKREDGVLVRKYGFHVNRNLKNLINFLLIIGFNYAIDKKTRYERRLMNKKPFLEKRLDDILLYEKVIKLRKNGYGSIMISRKLGLNKKNKYRIHHWVYNNVKPLNMESKKEIKKLLDFFNTTA